MSDEDKVPEASDMDDDREPAVEEPSASEAEAGSSQAAAPDGASASAESSEVGEAWNDVVASVTQFGEAMARWAKDAANDPENRRRLDDLGHRMDEFAREAEASFNDVSRSEIGSQVREGAQQVGQAAGDVARQVSDVAAPHVATVFGAIADAFGLAAESVDESVRAKRETTDTEPEKPAAASGDKKDKAPGEVPPTAESATEEDEITDKW